MTDELPKLSEDTVKRMKKAGLDPDNMTRKQLEVIESSENPEKYNWLTKFFNYIGFLLQLVAVFSLFSKHWIAMVVLGITGIIFVYIGYRIQKRVTWIKFIKASTRKGGF